MERLPQMAHDTKEKFRLAMEGMRGTTLISQPKVNPVRLGELLGSRHNEELLEATRLLLQMWLQNRDLVVYLSRIINLLPRDDLELKRVC